MDNPAFASLAHVQVLLLPVGSISQATFERYAAEIRSFESIRLGDIPADAKGERGESLNIGYHYSPQLILYCWFFSSIHA